MALKWWLAVCLVVVGALVDAASARDDFLVKEWDFQGDVPGVAARGFTSDVGEWKIVKTPDDHKVFAQLAKSEDAVFNVSLTREAKVKDLQLSVKMKAIAGENDQGGGLIWRARDAKNYYVARYNPLEDNFRVYKVVDGKRTMFKSETIPHSDGWHTLRVTMVGDKIVCEYDGKKALEVSDSTFDQAGRVGLWTKSDARTYFDEFKVRGR